jgi:hypothetical protein
MPDESNGWLFSLCGLGLYQEYQQGEQPKQKSHRATSEVVQAA